MFMKFWRLLWLIPWINTSVPEQTNVSRDEKTIKKVGFVLSLEQQAEKTKKWNKRINADLVELENYINGHNKFDQAKIYIRNAQDSIQYASDDVSSSDTKWFHDKLCTLVPKACKKWIEIHLSNLDKYIDWTMTHIDTEYIAQAEYALDYWYNMLGSVSQIIDTTEFKQFLDESKIKFETLKENAYSMLISKKIIEIKSYIDWKDNWLDVVRLIADIFLSIEATKTLYKDFLWKQAHDNLRKLMLPACIVLINTKLDNLTRHIENSSDDTDNHYIEELEWALNYWKTLSRGISSFFNIEQFLDFIDEVETKFKIIKENLNNEAEKS